MSVVIDAVSVIVRVQTIEDRYPGGLRGYEWDCPNRTFCCDGTLTRVAFMTGADAQRFIDSLEQRGLIRQRDGIAMDIATVEQFVYHPSPPCPWITIGIHPEQYASAWLSGAEPGTLAHPDWWSAKESAQLIRVPADQVSERLLPLTPKGPMQEVLHYDTGTINFVGHAYNETPPGPIFRIAPELDGDRPTPPKKPD